MFEAYVIKRTLPRIVAAIILVQLSFFLCRIMIDVSNVLGGAIYGLIDALAPSQGLQFNIVPDNLFESGILSTLGVETVGLAAGAGALFAASASVGALFFAIIGVLPAALLAILAVILTLIFRQMIIIALIVTSPIALVAFVLPNTERFAKIWFSSFMKVLLMYPLIMGLLASGSAFSAIVLEGKEGAANNIFWSIAVLLANIAPLFLIPFTFKFAGAGMNSISGALNGINSKILGPGGVGANGKPNGLNAKWKSKVGDSRNRLAAGQSRLNAVPGLTTLAKEKSLWSQTSSKRRNKASAKAASNYRQNIGKGQQRIQEEGLQDDADALTLLGFGSREQAQNHINRSVAAAAPANQNAVRQRLEGRLNDVNHLFSNNDTTNAASLMAAQNGWMDNHMLASLRNETRGNSALQNNLAATAQRISGQAGRHTTAAGAAPSAVAGVPGAFEQYIQQRSGKDLGLARDGGEGDALLQSWMNNFDPASGIDQIATILTDPEATVHARNAAQQAYNYLGAHQPAIDDRMELIRGT